MRHKPPLGQGLNRARERAGAELTAQFVEGRPLAGANEIDLEFLDSAKLRAVGAENRAAADRARSHFDGVDLDGPPPSRTSERRK